MKYSKRSNLIDEPDRLQASDPRQQLEARLRELEEQDAELNKKEAELAARKDLAVDVQQVRWSCLKEVRIICELESC